LDNPVNGKPRKLAAQAYQFARHHLNWLLGGALALLLLQDILGTHGLLAMRRSHQEAVQVQKEIDQISQENRQLQDRVTDLKSDPKTIERIAREEMGLARPGEYIFKTTPKSSSGSQPESMPANPTNKP
jgi:cell division protein FtsB